MINYSFKFIIKSYKLNESGPVMLSILLVIIAIIAIALGILIYKILVPTYKASRLGLILFSVLVPSYIILSFLSHFILVDNQIVQFFSEIVSVIELPLILIVITEGILSKGK